MKDTKNNILFLGAGKDQLPAIKKAIELGLGVYAFDGNSEAVGKEFVDGFICGNIKDLDWCKKEAVKLNKKVEIDGVMTPAVEVGPSVGRIADKLGLIGVDAHTADLMTDKVKRCQMLDTYNILQPNYWIAPNFYSNSEPEFPCVIKPKNKCAAEGVKLIENKEQLKNEKYDLAQEYLEGWELSTEIIIFKNQQFIYCNSDRNYDKKLKWKPYLLEDGCQIPSKIPLKIDRKIGILINKLIRIFNLSQCVMKLDLLVKDNRVYVLEAVPRLGGGKLSSIMIEKAIGIDWWKLAIKVAMDMPISQEEITPKQIKYCAQRYLFPDNPTSHRSRIDDVIEVADTYDEAVKKAENAITKFNNKKP